MASTAPDDAAAHDHHDHQHGNDHCHDHDHDHDHHHHDGGGSAATSWVGADGRVYHSHDGLAPHSHEPIYSPGLFSNRAPPLPARDFRERAFTVGIGGPVGTGKTALMLALCEFLRAKYSLAAVASVILATAGAVHAVKNFENAFNNPHQRMGLALYALMWLQPLSGIFRPHRGAGGRTMWFFVHWFLGTGLCILAFINIYFGLSAYHVKTLRSTRIWTLLFTAEVSMIAFIYLLQDRWVYMQKQGVILDHEQITPADQLPTPPPPPIKCHQGSRL